MTDHTALRAHYDAITAELEAVRDEFYTRPLVRSEGEYENERRFGYAETFAQYCAHRKALRERMLVLEDEQFALNAELFV